MPLQVGVAEAPATLLAAVGRSPVWLRRWRTRLELFRAVTAGVLGVGFSPVWMRWWRARWALWLKPWRTRAAAAGLLLWLRWWRAESWVWLALATLGTVVGPRAAVGQEVAGEPGPPHERFPQCGHP